MGLGPKSIAQWQGDGLAFDAQGAASGTGAAAPAPANAGNAGCDAANGRAGGTVVVRK
jgi:hypothetical protein